jgi:spermine oxidase
MAEDSDEGHTGNGWREQPKIVIIGAGISGITAGQHLANAGFTDFVILEATDHTGGRIATINLESSNTKAELGANWIHGIERNPIFKLCIQKKWLNPKFAGRKFGQKHMFLTENGAPVHSRLVEEVDWVFGMLMSQVEDFFKEQMPTPLENDSVGAFLEREFEAKLQSMPNNQDHHLRRVVFHQRMLNEAIIAGCHNMKEVALSEEGSFEELPGVHYVIPPGFHAVVEALAQDIENSILLDHGVSQVTWSGEGQNSLPGSSFPICVECVNGKKFYANHVINTVSLGYLKKHAGRFYSPPLPENKLRAIDNISIGTVNKIVIEFESGPILPNSVNRLEVMCDRVNLDEEPMDQRWNKKISFFEAIADNVLIGWLCGREAEYMETLPEQEIGNRCVEMLKKMLRVDFLPRIRRIICSRWKSNPYTLGSYSFIPVGASAEDIDTLAEPVTNGEDDKPMLLFAGEATHSTFYSSSHGAMLSGQREAERIIDLYNQ